MFNIILNLIVDAEVLDLYAGTGNLGIEALSRGAKAAVFIDKSQECAKIIRENLKITNLSIKGEVITCQVLNGIKMLKDEKRKFNIVFMDPPYGDEIIEETLAEVAESCILEENGIVIAEHNTRNDIKEKISGLSLIESRKYGDTTLSFYKMGR
jgi:16S rRNA (guanine966-N2)-methyltransferase